MGRLDNKVALITGAGAGLGAQIARRFREEGAELVINDIHGDSAQKLAEEVAGIGRVNNHIGVMPALVRTVIGSE